MSDDLKDEIEVINSIYGDGTLKASSPPLPDYILALPGGASSLVLRLPESYPAVPPQVLGTHSAGDNAARGAGARDLALFRDAVAAVYQPGAVCLFDAMDEFSRWLEAARAEEAEAAAAASAFSSSKSTSQQLQQQENQQEREDSGGFAAAPPPPSDPLESDLGPAPPWVLSEPVTELKSVFLARTARVSSAEQAAGYVRHLLATDKKARGATHNMTAWRVRGAGGTSFQDCDDDGEAAAGGRLLRLMQLMDLWDVVVVVTRWYGGVKLGPRRFALINTAARDAFVRAGFVGGEGSGQGNGHGQGGKKKAK